MAFYLERMRRYLSIFLVLVFSLVACTSQMTTAVFTPTPSSLTEDRLTPTLAPAPETTSTSEPLRLFVDESLPGDVLAPEDIQPITMTDDPGGSLWLGERSNAPDGEILTSSTWIYALAAPFPTLLDNVELMDLQALWCGEEFGQASGLYVPETLKTTLDSRWGGYDESTVEFYDTPPNPDVVWEENAWAILPFESLSPRLKVISVEGVSPLFKTFDAEGYPLTVEYDLVLNADSRSVFSDSDIQTLISALQPTNRDPEKMTTLIMTGVTALVRATAYRMEINGVTYPGEEIVDWLSEADLTHISNEVSFYEDCPFPDPNSGMLLFCSNPDYIALFDFIGADIIELTGNHNNDSLYVYGDDVVPFSLERYDQHGMVYYGGGLNLADAMKPLLVTHNGNSFAFIGCNSVGPEHAWATDEQGGAAPCGDYQWMADEVSRLSQQGYLTIATFQYQENYSNTPSEEQVADFGLMAESGAVIVNGSQAHRPKSMAFIQDAFVDFGLGNLFFDQMGIIDNYGKQIIQTRWEIIQRHTFYDGQHLSTELLTAMLEDYAQPRPMTAQERLVFLQELFTASGWDELR